MFDYTLLFDKPVIYTDTDFKTNPYDAFWIKEPLWTFEILPSLGLELNEENAGNIKDLIDKCIEDTSFSEGREKARSETWVHIGEGAERSVDFVLKKLGDVEKEISEEEASRKKSKRQIKKEQRKEAKRAETKEV